MTEWMFTGPQGHLSIPVRGTLSSNSVETTLAGVMDGVGNRVAQATRKRFYGDGKVPYTPSENPPKF
ncbi:MAG TPA: hypothetical protein DD666_20470 [Advenella kashmirensis]|uniref:Uncharacterized protein n=1 Tax=Advenella kashmirensis TaxID=310575 RepID=A0A356LL74_9BURK|nr:hypothetical protein [Advenella kashmirensis]